MTDAKYTMITIATCDASYHKEGQALAVKLAGELVDQAGALGARAGTVMTGSETGNLFLAQTYSDLAGIERAFDLYATSGTYQDIIGSGHISVSLRSLIKLEDIALSSASADLPGYLVLTRWRAADPMTERARKVLPVFEDNGATLLRYGSVMAGPVTGARVWGVAYPSMAAIEQTYAALAENDEYLSFVGDVEMIGRTIVRVAG